MNSWERWCSGFLPHLRGFFHGEWIFFHTILAPKSRPESNRRNDPMPTQMVFVGRWTKPKFIRVSSISLFAPRITTLSFHPSNWTHFHSITGIRLERKSSAIGFLFFVVFFFVSFYRSCFTVLNLNLVWSFTQINNPKGLESTIYPAIWPTLVLRRVGFIYFPGPLMRKWTHTRSEFELDSRW